MDIDYNKLRSDLMDYFGTAISFNPAAIVDLSLVEYATEQKLIEIALKNNFDITNYIKSKSL